MYMTSPCDVSMEVENKNKSKNHVLLNREATGFVRESFSFFFFFLRSVFRSLPRHVMRPTNDIFTSATDYRQVTTNSMRWFGWEPVCMI